MLNVITGGPAPKRTPDIGGREAPGCAPLVKNNSHVRGDKIGLEDPHESPIASENAWDQMVENIIWKKPA